MEFLPSRLRRGELITTVAALALLVLMLVLRCYGSRTTWQTLTAWRWLGLVTVVTAFALAYFQATRRAPALPAVVSTVLIVLSLLAALWLAVDVIVVRPAHERLTAVLELLAACGVFYGAFHSLRQEGILPRDQPTDIPTVTTGREVPS
jgi:hypothetical protein